MVCKIINLPKNYGHACEYILNNEIMPKLTQRTDDDYNEIHYVSYLCYV